MRYTETLGLPIYDNPETDLFKINEWNNGNLNIDNKTKEFVSSLEQITNVKITNDIAGTNYLANTNTDISYIKTLQAQYFARFIQKLRKNEEVIICCGPGDSLTYGHDISSSDIRQPPTDILPDGSQYSITRAGKTYPEALEEFLNLVFVDKVSVINRGYSGDYCSRALTRWNEKHSSDISIMMLGHNDSKSNACPYKGDVERFINWYEQLIIREILWGKAVIIMKSPRTLHANDMNIESFSRAVDLLAEKYGIPLIDTTPILSSYNIDIWSDETPENTNNIRTHLNTKGYTILGANIANFIIGKALGKGTVTNGDTLLFREQVDGVKYINNALNTEVVPNYTPFERTDQKSIVCRIGTDGKIIYSFYTESEDMVVIPTIYTYANAKLKFILDFGVEQPYLNLITKSLTPVSIGTKIPSILDLTSATAKTYKKDLLLSFGVEPLRMIKKGWHTLIIESDNSVLSGLEFITYSEWESLKYRYRIESNAGIIIAKYDNKYAEIIGKVQVAMPAEINIVEITNIPTNFTVLNRQCTIANKLTKSYASCYSEDGKHYIEVVNNGTQAEGRVAYVDYRLYGYYS